MDRHFPSSARFVLTIPAANSLLRHTDVMGDTLLCSSFAMFPGLWLLFSLEGLLSADPLAPPSFKDLAIAASACASSRFENMTSPKVFERDDRKRLKEYRESSQRTITFSVGPYSPVSFVGKLISAVGLVAVPYFTDIVRTMSSTGSPSVTYRS